MECILSELPCRQVHPVTVIPLRSTPFLLEDKLHPVPGYSSMWPACDAEVCTDDFLPRAWSHRYAGPERAKNVKENHLQPLLVFSYSVEHMIVKFLLLVSLK